MIKVNISSYLEIFKKKCRNIQIMPNLTEIFRLGRFLQKYSNTGVSQSNWAPKKPFWGLFKNITSYVPTRVFHENMFFKKKISATHHASAWGLVWKNPKEFFDFDQV